LAAPEVDTTLPLEEKPVGGLGIHLIRQSVDALEYRREGNRNILVMTVRIDDS
jgi:anti-sigma regulatory factor (Ser/Thr protein kinase)